jgi:hypothetical protein
MKLSISELKIGDFFFYESNDREENKINRFYYQKVSPQKDFNCVLLTTGELCNIAPESKLFTPVELQFNLEGGQI